MQPLLGEYHSQLYLGPASEMEPRVPGAGLPAGNGPLTATTARLEQVHMNFGTTAEPKEGAFENGVVKETKRSTASQPELWFIVT